MVAAGVNYETVEAKFQLKLQPDILPVLPLFSEPDTLRYDIFLGTGTGERMAVGNSVVGVGARKWNQNAGNHKKFNDDDTTD